MSWEGAVLGGLIGGAAMMAVLYPMLWMMPGQMKMNFLLMVGSMVAPLGAAAYAAGLMIHGMMSVAFGLVHGGLLEAFAVSGAGEGAALGALFGLVHALIVGAMLGFMPLLHPRMRPEHPKLVPSIAGFGPAPEEPRLDPPAFFAVNYPLMTVMGFFALHVMFGVIVGLVYAAFA